MRKGHTLPSGHRPPAPAGHNACRAGGCAALLSAHLAWGRLRLLGAAGRTTTTQQVTLLSSHTAWQGLVAQNDCVLTRKGGAPIDCASSSAQRQL
jgi:hypothetical protein